MESSMGWMLAVSTVLASPSRVAVALTASTPTRLSSASVAALSLIVSISTTRSRSEITASSSNRDSPTGPNVRLTGPIVTGSRGSSGPSANQVSASRAICTLTTEAGVISWPARSATSAVPSSRWTQSVPAQLTCSKMASMSLVITPIV